MAEEHFPRAGMGKEQSGDGSMVKETEEFRLSSHCVAPSDQKCTGTLGQIVQRGR